MEPVLTTKQQIRLCKPFTEHDIQHAIFSIPNSKSPRPDGYNSGFYKSPWNEIGQMVCEAIKEFFATCKIH